MYYSLLRNLRKISGGEYCALSCYSDAPLVGRYDGSGPKFDYSHKWYAREVGVALEYLAQKGKIQFCDNACAFVLTPEGMHPWHIAIEKLLNFFVRSVVIPIVVSAATSLTVLWLQGLL